jgi:hypothetical protein
MDDVAVEVDDSPTLSEIYLGYKPLSRRSEHPLSALFEVDDQRLRHVTMVVEHYSEEMTESSSRNEQPRLKEQCLEREGLY